MKGKNKCKILKQIRQKIADENDIPYVTRECGYKGDCLGTCPKCEAELRYLERELEKRRALGKAVAVAAVAAGLSLSLAACVGETKTTREELGGETVLNPGDTAPETRQAQPDPDQTPGEVVNTVPELVKGLIPRGDFPETLGYVSVCTEPAASTEPETTEPEIFELEGDVVFLPEEPDDLPQPEETEAPELPGRYEASEPRAPEAP